MKQELLTINPYSRPGKKLKSVRAIIVHWVANPGTTAMQNRIFFEKRAQGKDGYGSAHIIIDDNDVIECIPEDEVAYHVGANKYTDIGLSISSYPNARTLGVELCHPGWDGKPSDSTYKKALEYLAQRCKKYNLDPIKNIYRHYDITGKDCPKYYVENPDDFDNLKLDVQKLMDQI